MSAIVNLSNLTPEEDRQRRYDLRKERLRDDRQINRELDAEEHPSQPVTFYCGDDVLTRPDPHEIVIGRFIQGSTAYMVSPSGTGKTAMATDLALTLVTGLDGWFGAAVPKAMRGRSVIYLLAEGAGFYKYRVAAWLQRRRKQLSLPGLSLPPEFVLSHYNLRLNTTASVDRFLSAVAPIKSPGMVIIDTWNRHGAPETIEDIAVAIHNVDRIREATGACVLSLAHTPKDERQTMRGHSAPDAAADTVMYLADVNGHIQVRFEQRDLAPSSFAVRLEPIDLEGPEYRNAIGQPRSACVVELDKTPTVAAPPSPQKAKQQDVRIKQLVDYVKQHPGCNMTALKTFLSVRGEWLSKIVAELVNGQCLRRVEKPGNGAVVQVELFFEKEPF